MSESQEFFLNAKNLRITIYLSLAIANMIFGALYPESIIIAGCGLAFFGMLTLNTLRPEAPEKNGSNKKLVHLDK